MIQSLQPMTAAKHSQQLTHQAQKLVAQTFYGTLMKQMHDSPFKSDLMDGGRGGKAFQPLMDQHLIDRMAKSSGKKAGKLVRSVVNRLERNDAVKNRPAGVSTSSNATGSDAGSASQSPPRQPQQHAPGNPAHRKNRFDPSLLRDVRSHVATGLRA